MEASLHRPETTVGRDPLTFDRASGRLDGATVLDRAALLALQAGRPRRRLFGHRGYGLGCRIVASLAQKRDIIVRLNDDAAFAIPFCDGYWSRLLNRRYRYEAKIEAFLRSAARDRFFFVDCGANFGYRSVLASSRPFGSQSALAIEASSANARRLTGTSDLNGNRFRCLNTAVCGENGGFARVVGGRHEKFGTIALAQSEPNCVGTVSLDGLAEAGLIDSTVPVVVKLDVEGLEIEALNGGRGLLAGTVSSSARGTAPTVPTPSRVISGTRRR